MKKFRVTIFLDHRGEIERVFEEAAKVGALVYDSSEYYVEMCVKTAEDAKFLFGHFRESVERTILIKGVGHVQD